MWNFPHKMFYTAGSEAQETLMTQTTVQVIAGILCVVLIAIIILRRKAKKKSADDEF